MREHHRINKLLEPYFVNTYIDCVEKMGVMKGGDAETLAL